MKERIAQVSFASSYKTYDYIIPEYIDNLEIGDLAIVETNHSYQVVQIEDIVDYSNVAHKFIVDKVNLNDYKSYVKKKELRDDLLLQIEKRLEECNKMALYKQLAETDPIMKSLLEKLENL